MCIKQMRNGMSWLICSSIRREIEDVEPTAIEEKGEGEKAFTKEEKNWDRQPEEEGAGEEEQWNS